MAPIALFYMNFAGQKQLISKAKPATPKIDNDNYNITWVGTFGTGIDFRYNLKQDEFFKTIIINKKLNLPEISIDTTGVNLCLVMAIVWDTKLNETLFSRKLTASDLCGDLSRVDVLDEQTELISEKRFCDSIGRDIFYIHHPKAWDSSEERHFYSIEQKFIRSSNNVFMLFSVPKKVLIDATYPLYFDTDITEERTAASSDDMVGYATTYPGDGGYDTASNLYIGSRITPTPTRFYCTGVRFTSIPIPQGATIGSATIQIEAESGETDDLDVDIFGEDTDDAATFDVTTHTTAAALATPTAATALWAYSATVSAGQWVASPDVKSIVLEITSRPLWVSNNDMVFVFVDANETISGRLRGAGYDTGPSHAAKFNCSYTAVWSHTFNGLTAPYVGSINGVPRANIKSVNGVE
jgi:hypothetical protein